MGEYLYGGKYIFGIFFLYEDAIIGDSRIGEERYDVFYLWSLWTAITEFEEFISLSNE